MKVRKKPEQRMRQPGLPGRGSIIERRPVRATINDVARMANVSKKTVSRVLNNSPFVREATRNRIGAIINALGFLPDPLARGLAFRRSFLIGLICDDPLPQNTAILQQGILDALRGTGLELVIRTCDRAAPKLLQDIQDFVEGHRLFAVLVPAPADGRLINLLQELGCPFAQIPIATQDQLLRNSASALTVGLIAATRLPKAGHA